MTPEEFVRWVLALNPEGNQPYDVEAEQAYAFRRVRDVAAKVVLPKSEHGRGD